LQIGHNASLTQAEASYTPQDEPMQAGGSEMVRQVDQGVAGRG
jgi:hypothetical protein